MKLRLHERAVFRVPQFPVDAQLKESWDELKASIKIASADFYRHIEHLSFEGYSSLPENIKITVHKYFNRARFRATPYGTFAGFGLCSIGPNNQDVPLTITSKCTGHKFYDWSYTDSMAADWVHAPEEDLLLFTNSTYYRVGNSIRYVYRNESGFELCDVAFDINLSRILDTCRAPCRLSHLVGMLDSDGIAPTTTRELVRDMVDAQLLVSSLHPNIIGEDYFLRRGLVADADARVYTVTERRCLKGQLPYAILGPLKKLVHILHDALPPTDGPADLRQFIQAFVKKYDQMEIPIMQALDPEIGIGYGKLERHQGDSLASSIEEHKEMQEAGTENDMLRTSLLAQFASGGKDNVLCLDDLNPPERKGKLPLPNTFSALLTVADGMVQVEHLGGATATALHGRFSLAGGAMLHHCRELAGLEAAANPNVLFFDVGYMGEKQVDNVNRRASLYGLQLAILNYDISARPLTLDDVYLSVRGGELVLFSKKLGKRIVPRIATAYNYNRSDLSVFRLLCDVQQQGLQQGLMPDVAQMFPGLERYPRLQYRNMILSPARWRLDWAGAMAGDGTANERFDRYLAMLNLPGYIKAGHADQTLLLDTQKREDRELLRSILKARRSLWVQECPLPEAFTIHDEKGNRYMGEYVVSLVHSAEVYGAYTPLRSQGEVQRTYMPGSEWLYLELYCHPSTADELLRHEISTILERYGDLITMWFFIRYDDNGEHVRLRIKLKSPSSAGSILVGIHAILKDRLDNGQLSDLRIRCYHRELERYGADLMPKVERHFCLDSHFVLEALRLNLDDQAKYSLCISLMHKSGRSLFKNEHFAHFVKLNCRYHAEEHKMDGESFRKLNRAFEGYAAHRQERGNRTLEKAAQEVLSSFIHVMAECGAARKDQLFTDLFHMHINRLFAGNQRVHEMIIYEFLYKILKSGSKGRKTTVHERGAATTRS